MSSIVLLAPLSGVLVALDEVPDPVFAQRMVGDGVSVDPTTNTLVAPCAGRVVQVHGAGHALTIVTAEGLEVMMHIGLDTVRLKGQGFTPRVSVGAEVNTGDELIVFDADFVATHARSLLTQLVITNGERVADLHPATGAVRAGRDPVLRIRLSDVAAATDSAGRVATAGAPAAAPPGAAAGAALVSDPIAMPLATGLHARPAATIVATAKRFTSTLKLRKGAEEANAKSVVAIMGLEVGHGDRVQVVADGPDARAALAALAALVRDGLGEEGASQAPAARAAAPVARRPEGPAVVAPATSGVPADPNQLVGVAASPGIAVGTAFQVRRGEVAVPEQGRGAREEQRRLEDAIEQAKGQIEALQQRLAAEADAGKAAIFGAHRELLEDPALVEAAAASIAAGKSAAWAWRAAVDEHAARLGRSTNDLLAARANDLRDVGRRVLRLALGAPAEHLDPPAQSILFAEDLTPSDTASLDRAKVLGFCTTGGGATSHVAILARSLDLPAVAGIDPRALDVANGTPVVIDGGRGTVRLNPDPAEVARIRHTQARRAARRQAEIETAQEPATTRDGHRIEVAGNIGGLADAEQVPGLGGDGVGLLRSEFLFLDRADAPGEDEQADTYAAIARALGGRPLIIRTLDVGGDKPLPYLPMPAEQNPFLGERAIRLMLNRPELLRTQVRAILRAAAAGPVRIMVPMIATLVEWRAVKAVIEEERARLGAPAVPTGIMVEVPAAALLADAFAREVDFFSVGTNDLTQYTLAMDRGHPKLAPQVDGLNPAVLRLIAMTVEGAHAHGRWVGVCGGIGADPQAVPLLIGLGVDELSVSVPAIPAVKAQVRTLSREECAGWAKRALAMDGAADVRTLVPAGE